MNCRAATFLLILSIWPLYSNGQVTPQTLVDYDFEAANYNSGPDTFHIFEKSKGTVSISDYNYFSGYRALQIQDVAGDGVFPELQGYFDDVTQGKVYFNFAFMTTNPKENFNIALAGKGHYRIVQHGISFWLGGRNGKLVHHPEGDAAALFPLQAYYWYLVNVELDINRGYYHLTIQDEYEETIVRLENQTISAKTTLSSVNQYSFIGDLKDKSNTQYYVDDIKIIASHSKAPLPFIAPGRKKFFVDIWSDYYFNAQQELRCLPSFTLEDFGFSPDELLEIRFNLSDQIEELLEIKNNHPTNAKDKTPQKPSKNNRVYVPLLKEVEAWQAGCQLLENNQVNMALENFKQAYEQRPESIAYQLSFALGLFASGNDSDAYLQIAQFQNDDERWKVLLAMLALNAKNFYNAKGALDYTAPEISENLLPVSFSQEFIDANNALMYEKIRAKYPKDWKVYIEKALIADQYYFALLALKEYEYAQMFAQTMERLMLTTKRTSILWAERQADVAFFEQNLPLARDRYARLPTSISAQLKLADIYFLMGNKQREIKQREKIFGKLKLR